MSSFHCHLIDYGSADYQETLSLRYKILRAPLGLTFTADQLAAEADQIHLAGMVADRLIACLVLVPESHGHIKMRQVAVDIPYQGKGYGKQLIACAEQWAINHGYHLMHCHARETAIPFYLSMGYQTKGERFLEVTLPHMYMEKVLAAVKPSAGSTVIV